MQYKKLIIATVITSLFISVNAYSANFGKIKRKYGGVAGFSSLPIEEKSKFLGLEPGSRLKMIKKHTDENGNYHERFQQTYNGIPIWGEHITFHENSKSKTKRVLGKVALDLTNDLGNPGNPNKLKKKDEFYLNILKEHSLGDFLQEDMVYQDAEIKPYIYISDETGLAELVYEVSYFSHSKSYGHPSNPHALINVETGRIIHAWEGLATYFAYGRGPGGNYKVGQSSYGAIPIEKNGDTCSMAYLARNIYTIDNKNTWNLVFPSDSARAFSYPCGKYNENTYKLTNGGYSPINDIQFWANMTYSMFLDYLNAPPLGDSKMLLAAHVGDIYTSERAFVNAAWYKGALYFGEGNYYTHPLTSFNVVAHEIAHGFTEQNSGLSVDLQKQAGAINESFSDLAAEAAEYYFKINNRYNPTENDWLVNPDTPKYVKAFRYMYNPPLDGNSIDNFRDWTSSLDIHYASGVYNKAFYLLGTTTGWDAKKVFKLASHANKYYWKPTTVFRSGACGLFYSAEDMRYSVSDVIRAFKSVGVDPTCDD